MFKCTVINAKDFKNPGGGMQLVQDTMRTNCVFQKVMIDHHPSAVSTAHTKCFFKKIIKTTPFSQLVHQHTNRFFREKNQTTPFRS